MNLRKSKATVTTSKTRTPLEQWNGLTSRTAVFILEKTQQKQFSTKIFGYPKTGTFDPKQKRIANINSP